MKKIFTLAFMALACFITANAINFGIKVGNTEITNENFQNVVDPSITSGTVSYDPSTYTLTLNNVMMQTTEGLIYITAVESDVTINLVGYNRIGGLSAIQTNPVNTTITGDSLNAMMIMMAFGCNLTIKDAYVSINENAEDLYTCPMNGYNGNSSLTIDNSEIHAKRISGAEYGAIDQWANITLINSAIVTPAGGGIDSGCVKAFDGTRADAVDILPAEYYGITLVGTELFAFNGSASVNSRNCDNVILAGLEGTITFDPDNYVLTLDNAALMAINVDSCKRDLTIVSDSSGALITGIGNTTPINTTITGTSFSSLGIVVTTNNSLTISETTVSAPGGIVGDGTLTKLTVDHSNVFVEVSAGLDTTAGITGFNEIELINCEITKPTDAIIAGGSIKHSDGTLVRDTIIIVPTEIIDGIENVKDAEFGLYPNPAVDEVVLHLDNAEGMAEVNVISAEGRVVMTGTFNAETEGRLNVSSLAAGAYIVNVKANGKSHNASMIKK